MSYCVNCGVELDQSLTRCPLCKTPVVNPNHREAVNVPTTYPREDVQLVIRKIRRMAAWLITVIFAVPMFVCPLCDLIINRQVTWSSYVMTSVVFVWICSVPPILIRHNRLLKCSWIDYISCNIFLAVLNSLTTPEQNWYGILCLPITSFILFVILMFIFLFRKFDMHPLVVIGVCIAMAGILSVLVECLIMVFMHTGGLLVWSVPVVISCSAVSLLFIIISRMTSLRALIRRKMHI